MYKDLFGKTRQKVGLHIHTTNSDGKATPQKAIEIYKSHGYDAIAFTDHNKYNEGEKLEGITIISGAEYNSASGETLSGVYHILGLFTEHDPEANGLVDTPQAVIDKIHAAGGIAVLAHPAWSLNTPEMIMALKGIDATEIYNAVSECGQSFRPDSSILVDMLASRGYIYPLLATDDAHYYEGSDNCVGYIMAEAETAEPEDIKRAIIEKHFYASQGPEIHIVRDGDIFKIYTSPVEHIYVASNASWAKRTTHGDDVTYMEYTPREFETFVRAFCVDKNGKSAWTNIIEI